MSDGSWHADELASQFHQWFELSLESNWLDILYKHSNEAKDKITKLFSLRPSVKSLVTWIDGAKTELASDISVRYTQ